MYELDITREFSAAHSLKGYNGSCSCLHGHNWTVQIFIRATELDEIGIALDFRVLKKHLNEILEELDHKYLNELPAFQEMNPTSENLARYIFRRLSQHVNTENAKIHRVRVCESPSSGATYFETEF